MGIYVLRGDRYNECIEREAIIEKLNEIGGCDASDDFSKGWDKAIDAAIEAVEKLPAADAAPVKHGHWEEIRDAYGQLEGWMCKKCGREMKAKENYCPNCGAKMDDDIIQK